MDSVEQAFLPRSRAVRTLALPCIVVCSIVLATATYAAEPEEEENIVEITPFAGVMTGGEFEEVQTGSEIDIEDATNYALALDLTDLPGRQYQLLYSRQDTEILVPSLMDLQVQYLQIGGIVTWPDYRYVLPYFGATIGAAQFDLKDAALKDETKLSFSLGGGVKIPITKYIGLRFDLRGFITLLDNDSAIFCRSNPPNASCRIRTKSDTFLQYSAMGGITVGF